eukprot:15667859-Heterocapsa_arctica.AAC.1
MVGLVTMYKLKLTTRSRQVSVDSNSQQADRHTTHALAQLTHTYRNLRRLRNTFRQKCLKYIFD